MHYTSFQPARAPTRDPLVSIHEALEPRRLLSTASLVSDIVPGTSSGATYSTGQYAAVGGTLFFAGPGGLWKTDGTAEGTSHVKAITPVAGGQIASMISADGGVYFVANDGGGSQVWYSNGTGAGTHKVTALSGGENPGALTADGANNVLFQTLNTNIGIWRVTPGGGQDKLGSFSRIFILGVANGEVFFDASTTDGNANGLWVTDGGAPEEIQDFTVGSQDGLGSTFSGSYNGKFYFGANNGVIGDEPWSSNGTTTNVLADIDPGNDSSFPQNFTVSGNTLYFTASAGSGDLIYSTTGGTPVPVTATTGFYSNLTDAGGDLFFTLEPNGSSITRLYKLGGDVVSPVPLDTTGGTNPLFLKAVGDEVFFSGLGNDNIRHLFVSSGAIVQEVDGDAGTNPQDLAAVGNNLIYTASDPKHGTELHTVAGEAPIPFAAALRVNGHTTATIDEGGTVAFNALVQGVTRDQVSKYYWFFNATGAPVIEGPKPSFTYTNNLANNAPIDVRCKVVLKDGRIANAYAPVTVKNVGPSNLKVILSKVTTTYFDVPIEVTWDDPGSDRWDVTVDWGDGSPVDVLVGTARDRKYSHQYHKYSTESGRTVTVTVSDQNAEITLQQRIKIRPISDVLSGKKLTVFVGGTSGNDVLEIKASAAQPVKTQLSVDYLLNGEIVGHDTISKGVVLAGSMGPGNDEVNVDTALDVFGIDFEIVGGSGSDTHNGKPIK